MLVKRIVFTTEGNDILLAHKNKRRQRMDSFYRCFCCNFRNSKLNVDDIKRSNLGCRHSSVDLSASTILPPQVRVPSTLSMFLSFKIQFVMWKERKLRKKRPVSAHFLKKKQSFVVVVVEIEKNLAPLPILIIENYWHLRLLKSL